MQLRNLLVLLLTPFILLVSPLVLAHAGGGGVAGLADGFMHPATGLDHLLIAIAAGVWAGRSGDHGVPDVMYFLLLVMAGILLGICCMQFPQLQLQTLLVVGLTVMFIALSIAAPRYFAYIFFGGFAVYHGIVHMLEIPAAVTATGYIIGLILSTGMLLMVGLILRQVVETRKPHPKATH
ncbi:MAG: HupE/UreJ family protein [Gammaproteobacteria bacterium]|jgi:urease accessory protein|nr:HupE/UreJ family protein [Gammaproteobacteria bacterium]